MKEIVLIERFFNSNNSDTSEKSLSFDPTCFDHNLHIRLKKYKSDDLIAGFEQKLTFVIEYYLNKFIRSFPQYTVDFSNSEDDNSEAVRNAFKNYIFSKYINEFKQSEEYIEIVRQLRKFIDFNDIVIKPVYSKKDTMTKKSQFGNILDYITENANPFVKLRNVNPANMIIDDSISYLITNVEMLESNNLNAKYLNKNVKKLSREFLKSNGYQENKLW